MTTLLWVLGLSLGVSFLCSILEAVLLSVNHGYIQVLRDEGRRAGTYLHNMQKRIDEPISAILTLNTIAHTMGAALGGGLALQIFGDEWIALFSAGLTFTILLASEIIPKTLGATYWKELAPVTAWTLRGMVLVMKPVLIPLSIFSRVISRERAQQSTISRAELEVMAEIGRREGTLDEAEWQVVTNVMNLSEITVGAVMTPRTDMVAVPIEASVAEAKDVMLDEGHLRLPVYEDGRLDRIAGILLARDLWQADREGRTQVREILRPAVFAPASKPVEDLLLEMRRARSKMAMVVDEFGGIAGLVTLEDLIEEIVGEIQDEHEADEPPAFQRVGGGVVRVWGGVPLRDVRDALDIDLPETEHETIGGFVFGALNRVPRIGDEVNAGGGRFRVVKMQGRRIQFLRFLPQPVPDSPIPEPSAESSRDQVDQAPTSTS